jgi:DNA-directed RNA polymerase delta subunit
MNTLNLESTISKRAELLSSEIDGEVVMMNIDSGKYISMNSVGSEIWKMVEEKPVSINEICNQLTHIFNIEKETCEQEVLSFCSNLLKENLIILQ